MTEKGQRTTTSERRGAILNVNITTEREGGMLWTPSDPSRGHRTIRLPDDQCGSYTDLSSVYRSSLLDLAAPITRFRSLALSDSIPPKIRTPTQVTEVTPNSLAGGTNN